jgi:hypothetical protein
MTAHELAQKAAEEVLRQIERDKCLIKARIAEAIEKILSTHQLTHAYGPEYGVPTFMRESIDREVLTSLTLAQLIKQKLCGND